MELNKNNIKKILLIAVIIIIIFLILQNLGTVIDFLGLVISLISPFLIGLCIAFILNCPMRFIENKILVFKKPEDSKNKDKFVKLKKFLIKIKRPLSLILSLVFILGIVFIVMFMIIPEIGDTIVILKDSIPGFVTRTQDWYNNFIEKYPDISNWLSEINIDWDKVSSTAFNFLQNYGGNLLNSTVSAFASIIGGVINFILGIFFAFYILIQKEKLSCQIKKAMYSILPEHVTDKIIEIGRLTNNTFSRFLSGQCCEAVILGFMFFIAMTIFRFPYALMISVLIAFTALIPIVGAFIGCIVGAFLILIVDPVKALWFIVMFLVLQQIEGNFIYPKVVGNSVGLPSIWVLVAVTIGGSVMGITGMLLMIPLCSVLYALFREFVYKRIKKKRIPKNKYS